MATMRWLWRQLTSMRIALILLFLLALASVPGSIFPQRGTSPLRVSEFLKDNPTSGPILDRLYMFDVFASPWFASIYLLLFISLTGCVLPRALEHYKEVRSQPPAAPRNLSRLPVHMQWHSDSETAIVISDTAAAWKKRGWRVRQGEDWLSAEKGYARETGNLVFHLALLVLLIAVGFGGAVGYRGTVIVREDSGFANNVTQYDTFAPGRIFSADQLPPFSFELKKFTATFQRGGQQNGAPREFTAELLVKDDQTKQPRPVTVEVNHPLRTSGVTVYLVGHGFAPEFTIRDASGKVVWEDAAVFLPQDSAFTSSGVIKVPDTVPQLGIQGFFLPTVTNDFSKGPKSVFPAADDPTVYLSAYQGDLGLDSGMPQSVYRLDTKNMQRIGIEELAPGETWALPNSAGTLEFTGYREWASFVITKDPGKGWALGAAIASIVGLSLSLLIPRRRAWLRVTPTEDSGNLIEVAGLSKTEAPGLADEISQLAKLVKAPEAT
ncbi:MAG: cytochrome c biogenesis protein ResB [Actinobacteria bacterium]|nr:cytochrome c biogenesis protein ResB [Actinomycetota bacterium]NBO34954.1 cytochrome c biogenesis protein ResB [Actinomycetota bacterium]